MRSVPLAIVMLLFSSSISGCIFWDEDSDDPIEEVMAISCHSAVFNRLKVLEIV